MDIEFTTSYCQIFIAILCKNDAERNQLLENTGITSENLESLSFKISIAGYKKLLQNARLLTNDNHIMLKIADQLPITSHGEIGQALAFSPDRLTGIKTFVDFGRLKSDYLVLKLHQSKTHLFTELKYENQAKMEFDQEWNEICLFHLIVLYNGLFNRKFTQECPIEISLTQSQTPETSLIRKYIPCTVKYNQPSIGISAPLKELIKPLPERNNQLFVQSLEFCKQAYVNNLSTRNTTRAVNEIFKENPGRIWNIEAVAEKLSVSVRTLQRRLIKEGNSYRKLQEKSLKRLAEKYLIHERLSIETSAALIGYQDEASLRRAFKRWHGCSPTQYLDSQKKHSHN